MHIQRLRLRINLFSVKKKNIGVQPPNQKGPSSSNISIQKIVALIRKELQVSVSSQNFVQIKYELIKFQLNKASYLNYNVESLKSEFEIYFNASSHFLKKILSNVIIINFLTYVDLNKILRPRSLGHFGAELYRILNRYMTRTLPFVIRWQQPFFNFESEQIVY